MSNPMATLPGWCGGDGNAAYLDKTLRHGPMEEYFDEAVAGNTLWRLWGRAAVVSLLCFLDLSIFAAFGGLLMLAVAGSVAVAAFLLVFLLARLVEPVGEWRVVPADRAAAEMSVYSAIRGKLAERELPIESMRIRRSATGFGSVNNRLILTDGHYQVYVSVFCYGTSLYLGWMMWRTRTGAVLTGRFFSDLFAGLTGRLDVIGLMLRTERPVEPLPGAGPGFGSATERTMDRASRTSATARNSAGPRPSPGAPRQHRSPAG
jgi:hypothetical protein